MAAAPRATEAASQPGADLYLLPGQVGVPVDVNGPVDLDHGRGGQGAAGGRGRRSCRGRAGHTVYVGSRDASRGKEAVADIAGDTRLLILDVTDAGNIAAAARQVPLLDILVNNAGISSGDPEQVTLRRARAAARILATPSSRSISCLPSRWPHRWA